jgi:hypothetical protein
MESSGMAQLAWHKSSNSGDQASDCVETAALASGVVARDSRDPQGPVLHLTGAAWMDLLGKVKSGSLDL